jgi:DNA-binding CsgD family transcriptional regulator
VAKTSDGELMKQLETDARKQLFAASHALDAILSSTDPADLCRQIVHSDYVPRSTRGCEIFYLDGKSVLRSVGSYGISAGQKIGMSAWDDSPLSKAIREKSLAAGPIDVEGLDLDVIAIPFVTHGVPVGLMAVVIEDKSYQLKALQEASELFFKLGAFYLESLDLGNTVKGGAPPIPASPEDLSGRQLTILGYIQNGLVNLEIAKELMLSESTIRQETVRIYRALSVGNRLEAVKKARSLGLIGKRPLPLEL